MQVPENQPPAPPSMKDAVIVFIRNPVLGKVKKRLAASVGDERAWQIYLSLLRHTCKVSLQIPVTRYVYYSDFIGLNDGWNEAEFIKKIQQGVDLGARMLNAIEEALSLHDRVVLFGGDIPGLSPELIKTAFEKLEDYDFVLGPALDGGYYLIGMKHAQPVVFQDITWSAPQVFEQTNGTIQRLGKTCFHLPALADVDFAEDWERWGWSLIS